MPIQIDSVLNGKLDPRSYLEERFQGQLAFYDRKFIVRGASGELPQWIKILADDWETYLKVGAGAFFSAFSAKAGGYTWDKRHEIVSGAIGISETILYKLSHAVYGMVLKCGINTSISIGIPYPDDHFGTTIRFIPRDVHDIIIAFSLLYRDLSIINEEALKIRSENHKLLAGISVEYIDWKTIIFKYHVVVGDEMKHAQTVKIIP